MKITISTDEGVVVKIIDLNEYDLNKPLARADLLAEIREALEENTADD